MFADKLREPVELEYDGDSETPEEEDKEKSMSSDGEMLLKAIEAKDADAIVEAIKRIR